MVTRPIQRRDLLCIDQLQTRERTGPLSSERVYSNGTVHIGVYRELQFSSGDVDKPLDACVYQGSMRQREALDIAPRGLYYAPHGLSAVSLLQPVRMSRSVARLQGNGLLIIVLYWSCHVARKRVGATSSGALYFARLRRASVFTARCYASAVLAMGLCLSVSVCLSQVGVLLKRLNESGWFLACELPSTCPTLC